MRLLDIGFSLKVFFNKPFELIRLGEYFVGEIEFNFFSLNFSSIQNHLKSNNCQKKNKKVNLLLPHYIVLQTLYTGIKTRMLFDTQYRLLSNFKLSFLWRRKVYKISICGKSSNWPVNRSLGKNNKLMRVTQECESQHNET